MFAMVVSVSPAVDLAAPRPRRPAPAPTQTSFDDLGRPLHDVTFCVLDLETTGADRNQDMITEIGAVLMRGGECLGTFQTMVNPGRSIPPEITVLTGISESMVLRAPRIESVLPSLLEFIGQAVVVGHNVGFDLGFLRAALTRSDRPAMPNTTIDTLALARRLVGAEVPNCKLGTLASRLRLAHRPNHRALDDALTTADLLHHLLERAACLGVLGLDDLVQLPRLDRHPQSDKLTLTIDAPRSPGVYVFEDTHGSALYIGKAANLRSRVRSYFSSDRRRKVAQLLRETQNIRYYVMPGLLEAEIAEIRLIHQHLPRFNRQATTWDRYVYLKLTLNERFPRLSVVKDPREDGALYLGPLTSRSTARLVADAIETAVPLRRCSGPPAAGPKHPARGPCVASQLGVSTCPCSGEVDETAYRPIVERAVAGLTTQPSLLLEPLFERMRSLASQQRFEEAAEVRERTHALTRALHRQRQVLSLHHAGWLEVAVGGVGGAAFCGGILAGSWAEGAIPALDTSTRPPLADGRPLPRHQADEVWMVADWLDRHADRLTMSRCDGTFSVPATLLPDLRPRSGGSFRPDR